MGRVRIFPGIVTCLVGGIVMVFAGCGGAFRGVEAEYWNEKSSVVYTSLPGLVASVDPVPRELMGQMRSLIDSLGLVDVTADAYGAEYAGSMMVLAHRNGAAFDRMNSPELAAVRRIKGVYYGPIADLVGYYGTSIFSRIINLSFRGDAPLELCDSVVRALQPESYGFDKEYTNKYWIEFQDSVGEGIVDMADRLRQNPYVVRVVIQRYSVPVPLGD